jgi:glycosyltransferase involved in cell wall biosynthesis
LTRRIRIARIIARLNVGGPTSHVASLTGRLPPERFETRLFAGDVSPGEIEMSEVLVREGIEPRRVPRLGRRVRATDDLAVLLWLARELRRFQPDIVHTHTAKAGALGRLAARLVGVPRIVHTFHGHVFDGYFSPLVTKAIVRTERALARLTDMVITISARQQSDIATKYRIAALDRTRVIPLGFDLRRFLEVDQHAGQLRSELGLDPSTPIVSTVGRLTKIKDHALLLRAFARLHVPSALVLVGDGEERQALEALAVELGIRTRVHFLGFRTDLERVLADSTVVALTSINEGTPVALIEALAASRPVISTDVGGVADVLRDGTYGKLVRSRDPAAFAEGLQDLLGVAGNAAARSRAWSGRDHALRNYDVTRLVNDHAELYSELMADVAQ